MTACSNPIARSTLHGSHDLELIMVRHGQQVPPEARQEHELRDPPLSPIGERQIEAVADHLATEEIDAVYSSHQTRAHQTGLAIAARHGLDLVMVEDLREVEVMRDVPMGTTCTDIDRHPEWAGAGERFVETGQWSAFPFSEPGEPFRQRVTDAVEGVLARHTTGKVIVACHAGVINAYLASLLDLRRDFWFRTAHCAVNRILVGGDRRAVWNLNEVHHLPGELATA